MMVLNKKCVKTGKLITLFVLAFSGQGLQAAEKEISSNPQLSVVIDGGYMGSSIPSDEYSIPGFQLGEEAELALSGFQINEAEVNFQSNIDPYWFGNVTIGMHQHGHHTEFDLEEAYIRTLALGKGLSVTAGRFYSGIGYLNHHHRHQWDFADVPLVYRALFNNQYRDDGIQVQWVAPTDVFWELGVEAFPGRFFPASGSGNRLGSFSLFTHLGGDLGSNQSWQVGASSLQAKPNQRIGLLPGRSSGGHSHDHAHGHDHHHNDFEFTGQSHTWGIDAIWKWAPTGNAQERQWIVQGEIYTRHENGSVLVGGNREHLDSSQQGAYLQTVYQFRPKWRAGVRYDRLRSDNKSDNHDLLHEINLAAHHHEPHQLAMMLDYSPSEFSRIRLQYNRDYSSPSLNQIVMLQFTVSLGAHGAHAY